MFKSATSKLTVWYVIMFMGLSLVFSVVLYHFAAHELQEALHDQFQAFVINDHDADNRPGLSTNDLNARSSHLLDELVYFNVVVFAGASIASYILARRTMKPIEKSHQAQIDFTAQASHELRTPLTAMKADTEITLMEKDNDARVLRRTLQNNLKDIERLEKLSNNLLELSRFESGVVHPAEIIDLDSVIQEILQQVHERIRASHLHISADISPVQIKGDLQGIGQLVTIVLDNAIKYSRPKGTVKIGLRADEGHALITIEDQGVGIKQEDLPHVFERFYRSRSVTVGSPNVVGYGLGLSLAQGIATLHKGSIAIHSQENAGTSVTITLPRLRA